MQNAFFNAMEKGGLIDAGTHDVITKEEMGVPNWVIEKDLCPGLPKWEALQKCYAAFATPDSGGKGRWLEGPQSWHGDVMPNRLKGLGLDNDWTVKFAGAADALWAELKSAEKEGRGTVIFNWSPNFTDATGFTFIEFPPYYDGCRLADGGSVATTGCGSPTGWLKKGAHYKFSKTHPKAYSAFSKTTFNKKHIGQMAATESLKDQNFIKRSIKHNLYYAKKLKSFLERYEIFSNPISANFLFLDLVREYNFSLIES